MQSISSTLAGLKMYFAPPPKQKLSVAPFTGINSRPTWVCEELPTWLSGKGSTCKSGDAGDTGLIPGLGRSHAEGHVNPLQYCCLKIFMERGAWQAAAHGVTESRTH